MRLFLFAIMIIVLAACTGPAPAPTSPAVGQTPKAGPESPVVVGGLPAIDCSTAPFSVALKYSGSLSTPAWSKTVEFPVTGKFVLESHYVTKEDSFPGGRLFANTSAENIQAHLDRACELYQNAVSPDVPCAKLHSSSYERVWTPAEKGKIGQAARGDRQAKELTAWDEMWQGNMMFDGSKMPPVGTKVLAQAKGKSVVIQLGWEQGPGSTAWAGGMTPEAHFYLGSGNEAPVTWSYLKDQSVKTGPVNCK